MIELFNLIKEKREKTIKIKCNHVSYWRSESEKINSLIQYIEDNKNNFCIDIMEIGYGNVMDDIYVQSFDISAHTDQKTYDYIKENFDFLLEKYDKYIINLDDVKFYSLSTNDFSRLRIH